MNAQKKRLPRTPFFLVVGLILMLSLAHCSDGDDGGGNGPSVPGEPTFTLYDDFSLGIADGTKWDNSQHSQSVQTGGLVMSTSMDNMVANLGYTNNLYTTVASASKIQADVNLALSTLGTGTRARAIVGLQYQPALYRDISGQDFTWARVEIQDDGTNVRVRKSVGVCSNADCSSYYTIANDFENLATIAKDQWITATVEYVSASNSFVISMDDGINPVVTGTTVDMTGVTAFSSTDFAHGRLRSRVIGGGTDGESASVQANFDNVLIDGALYDGFSAANIDTTKWQGGDLSRTFTGGAVEFTQTQADQAWGNHLNFLDPDSIKGIKADVRLTTYTVTGTDPWYRAHIGGAFYNDGTLGGTELGSAVSDIFADVNMVGNEIFYRVVRCTDKTCSTTTGLTDDGSGSARISMETITPGTAHTLMVKWDGALFTFQLDSQTPVTFDPIAAGAPVASVLANRGKKIIGTRANPATGDESGTLAAAFDNVFVLK